MTLPSIRRIENAIDWPADEWLSNCHAVSLAAVRSGLLGKPGPGCRVVRGWTFGYGIFGQHSWIALGRPFDPGTRIVDLTVHAWEQVEGIVDSTVGTAYETHRQGRGHLLHGYQPGTIWEYGRPGRPDEAEAVDLDRAGLSRQASEFLDVLGPLSTRGWMDLVTYPHGGWPAHEICEAIVEQLPRASILLPIDVVAHVTDRNPEELYW